MFNNCAIFTDFFCPFVMFHKNSLWIFLINFLIIFWTSAIFFLLNSCAVFAEFFFLAILIISQKFFMIYKYFSFLRYLVVECKFSMFNSCAVFTEFSFKLFEIFREITLWYILFVAFFTVFLSSAIFSHLTIIQYLLSFVPSQLKYFIFFFLLYYWECNFLLFNNCGVFTEFSF